MQALLALSAALLLSVGCSSSSDVADNSVATSASTSVSNKNSSDGDDGNLIPFSDIALKSKSEAEGILLSGTWRPEIAVERIFRDPNINTSIDAADGSWLVIAMYVGETDPNVVTLVTAPPQEVSDEQREFIRDGDYLPRAEPEAGCNTEVDSFDLDAPNS